MMVCRFQTGDESTRECASSPVKREDALVRVSHQGVGGGVLVVVSVRVTVFPSLETVMSFSSAPPLGPVFVTSRVKPLSVFVRVESYVEVLPLKPVRSPVVVRPVSVFSLVKLLLAVLPLARLVEDEPVPVPVAASFERSDSRVLILPFGLV